MIVNDFRTSPYTYPLFVERMEHVAVLAEPLLYRERLVGVLAVNRNDPARPFTLEDQRLVRLFASQAAIAIVNAHLYREGEIRQQQFATLVQVTQRLTRGLDLTNVMAAIAEAATTLFQGDAGFRLLEGDYLVRKFVTPRAREVMRVERIRLGESLSGRVAVSGEAIVTRGYPGRPPPDPGASGRDARSRGGGPHVPPDPGGGAHPGDPAHLSGAGPRL